MEDERILDLFFAWSQQALREVDAKYGRLCLSLAGNFLRDERDAEECVNDAWLGAWNAIPPARPCPLRAWLCRVVRNLALKRQERETAAKRGGGYSASLEELEDCLAAGGSLDETMDARELARQIEVFLDGLSRQDRAIFLRRYWFADPCAEIGRRVGLSEKAVSVRLVRQRQRLRRFLIEKGVLV